MGIFTLILTAASLSADAFAAALCKGLSKRNLKIRHMLTVGLFFGVFQAIVWCIEQALHWEPRDLGSCLCSTPATLDKIQPSLDLSLPICKR